MPTVYIEPENITADRTLLIPDTSGSLVPPGSLLMFAGSVAPEGYLVCDGAAISRTTYAVLFATIGTTWGVGNGTTTFNLPDLRGRGPIGVGTGAGLSARALGASGGTETVTLTATEMPSHTHTSNATGGQGNYGLAIADGTNTADSVDASLGELNLWTTPGALTINATGGGGAHANMQPFAAVNFIIKT